MHQYMLLHDMALSGNGVTETLMIGELRLETFPLFSHEVWITGLDFFLGKLEETSLFHGEKHGFL